jgi:hypothetical protein
MFRKYAEAQDKALVTFFQNEWDKSRKQSIVEGRTKKPRYFDKQIKAGVRPKRLSLNLLVFEAFGSTINPDDFVLLESAINLYKMELWSLKNPMTDTKYKKAYMNAMSGAGPSSVYLSAIRTVGLVSLLRFLWSLISTGICGLQLSEVIHGAQQNAQHRCQYQTRTLERSIRDQPAQSS